MLLQLLRETRCSWIDRGLVFMNLFTFPRLLTKCKFYVPETHIMYFIRRCWFLKCSEEIHYVPIGDGWEEVLVRNCLALNSSNLNP
jgi:hypothetical protein